MLHPDSAATSAACRGWRAAVVGALLLLPVAAWAQQTMAESKPASATAAAADTLRQEPIYKLICPVEPMPSFRGGGSVELIAYIQRQLRWPARAHNLPQGRVFVCFVVDTTGWVRDVKIVKGLHPLLDAEALRVIRALTGFTPALQRGRPLATGMTVPVQFKIR
jgi:TonB family protein